MGQKILAVFVICLFLGASATLSVGKNEELIEELLNDLDYQKTGTWVLGMYGDYSLEPPGSGNHYLYAYTPNYGEEASYFTPPLDLSGLTMVNLTFAYSYSYHPCAGETFLSTYSGGTNINDLEEVLMYWEPDGDDGQPGSHVTTFWLDPSTYDSPNEVYIEFWYVGEFWLDYPQFSIDDITIPEVGYFESFEVPYTGSLSGSITDIFLNPIENVHVNVSFHNTYEEDYTDDTGNYQVTNIPLCWCYKNVTASKDGYKTEWVLMPIEEESTHDFILMPANMKFCSNLSQGWNFVSLPFNGTIDTTDFIIKYDGYFYTWDDAVANCYVSDYLFGWNRNTQSYIFTDNLESGQGYWMYVTCSFKLYALDPSSGNDDNNLITDVKEDWNIMGIPFDFPINKSNVVVVCGGVNYGWYEAVDLGIINEYIFGWDPIAQSYWISNTFEPGHPYWLYAYQDCILYYENTLF